MGVALAGISVPQVEGVEKLRKLPPATEGRARSNRSGAIPKHTLSPV